MSAGEVLVIYALGAAVTAYVAAKMDPFGEEGTTAVCALFWPIVAPFGLFFLMIYWFHTMAQDAELNKRPGQAQPKQQGGGGEK